MQTRKNRAQQNQVSRRTFLLSTRHVAGRLPSDFAGDIVIPMKEGIIDSSHVVGELGELLLGRCPGRDAAGPEAITLFKSLGTS